MSEGAGFRGWIELQRAFDAGAPVFRGAQEEGCYLASKGAFARLWQSQRRQEEHGEAPPAAAAGK